MGLISLPCDMDAASFKIVLLGEGCVGKTSIVLRYCENQFNENHITTIQASFLRKALNISAQRVNLAIWDTAGQERFHALGPIYYRDANGALLVYDVTDRDSFLKVKMWVKELRRMLGADIALTIAGNKVDLPRVVPLEEAEAYAATVGAKHFNTSAKKNEGIEELFLDLAKRMVSVKAGSKQKVGSSAGGGGQQIILGKETPPPSDTGCC